MLNNGKYPDFLKEANITPIFKNESLTEKTNYRSINILPNLSKICEFIRYDQLSNLIRCTRLFVPNDRKMQRNEG